MRTQVDVKLGKPYLDFLEILEDLYNILADHQRVVCVLSIKVLLRIILITVAIFFIREVLGRKRSIIVS